MLVASGGSDGTKLFDIRQNSFRYMEIDLFRELICAVINSLFLFRNADSFSSPFGTTSARLDRRGSRLLCREFRQFPVVYDVPTEQQMGVASTGKIQFTAQRCSPYLSRQRYCFAGQEDEVVVSAESNDSNLSIWSLPESQGRDQVVDQPLAVLKGHKGPINSICYSHRTETLASAGAERIIKLWSPITPE